MVSFEFRSLCKIFLLPKKREEAEPMGFQLGPSVPAGWHHPRNCHFSFCILAVFKVCSLMPSQKLSFWEAWRELLALGWWNPSGCFVSLVCRAWRCSGLLSPGVSPATVTPAMWFTLASDLAENQVSVFNSFTITLLISFTQPSCQRVAEQLLPLLPWGFSPSPVLLGTWEGLFQPDDQVIIPIVSLRGGRMVLGTQNWFHLIPRQNCLSHCLGSSWACRAGFKARFPQSNSNKSTFAFALCTTVLWGLEKPLPGVAVSETGKPQVLLHSKITWWREHYVMASCDFQAERPDFFSSFFYIFGFKLCSIFGKPEHLDFASLLAKGI